MTAEKRTPAREGEDLHGRSGLESTRWTLHGDGGQDKREPPGGAGMSRALEAYRAALSACPQSGGGVHAWMMGTANLAAKAGVPAVRALVEIALATASGHVAGEVGIVVAMTYWEGAAFVPEADDMLMAELSAFSGELEWLRAHGREAPAWTREGGAR